MDPSHNAPGKANINARSPWKENKEILVEPHLKDNNEVWRQFFSDIGVLNNNCQLARLDAAGLEQLYTQARKGCLRI